MESGIVTDMEMGMLRQHVAVVECLEPLSRLTYGVYLVQIVVMFVIGGNFQKPIYMDHFSATVMFLSSTVLSFLLSFIFSMMVEAPTLGLEKAVLGKIFRAKK
ncbi:hypothetical protein ACOMHN_060017 [Nucella lapillus]